VARDEYLATGRDGRRPRGTPRASTRDAAEHAPHQRDRREVRVNEKPARAGVGRSGVKREEVMHLSRQLSAFVRAGLPLIEAVHMLGAESSNASLRKTMADVEQGLHRGDSLSICLDRHPRIFPAYYRGILRSAELTGHLDAVLDQLAKYLERDLEARRKIKQALIYPVMIVALAVVTVVILAGFVLPRFRTFFESLDAELPLAPRILLAVTDFILAWWFPLLVGLVVAVILVLRTRRPALRSRPSRALLWTTLAVAVATLAVPFLGPLSAVFGFVPLSAPQMATVLAIVFGYVAATEGAKAWFYRMQMRAEPTTAAATP